MGKRGKGLWAVSASTISGQRMARAGEQLFGAGRVQDDGKAQPASFVHRLVSEAHRWHRPGECRPLPGDVHEFGIGDPDHADGPGAHSASARSPSDWAWEASGPGRPAGARQKDDDLATNIEIAKVVVSGFGDREPVAGEYELGVDRRGRVDLK